LKPGRELPLHLLFSNTSVRHREYFTPAAQMRYPAERLDAFACSHSQKGVIMIGTAKATVFIDNEKVIVTEYRFAPGQNTGWHRHGHDYVVVPLMDGKVKLETADGTSFAEMKKGVPYFRNEGVEHDVINANDGEYAFIEIELK
jgi:beta-alanine degradation protein BauB